MPKLDGYLRIKQAAEYLGVSPNTLRNWGRSGRLAERRHPMNGYRLYSTEELDALLTEVEQPAITKLKRRNPSDPSLGGGRQPEHIQRRQTLVDGEQ